MKRFDDLENGSKDVLIWLMRATVRLEHLDDQYRANGNQKAIEELEEISGHIRSLWSSFYHEDIVKITDLI